MDSRGNLFFFLSLCRLRLVQAKLHKRTPGYDALCTPFRTADLIAIHCCDSESETYFVFQIIFLHFFYGIFLHFELPVLYGPCRPHCIGLSTFLEIPGCIAFGWAESHGHMAYTGLLVVLNIGCLKLKNQSKHCMYF